MKNLHIGARIGMIMELIAGLLMAVLVLLNKPVPNLVAWIFGIGLVITLGTLFIPKDDERK